MRPTPGGEGLAEVFLVPFQPHVPGDVNEAVKAQGGIDEKARQVYAGEAELPLQGLIDDGLGLTQIVQKIADAALNEPGCHRIVGDGEGPDQDAVEGRIEVVHHPVGVFPGVDLIIGALQITALGDDTASHRGDSQR